MTRWISAFELSKTGDYRWQLSTIKFNSVSMCICHVETIKTYLTYLLTDSWVVLGSEGASHHSTLINWTPGTTVSKDTTHCYNSRDTKTSFHDAKKYTTSNHGCVETLHRQHRPQVISPHHRSLPAAPSAAWERQVVMCVYGVNSSTPWTQLNSDYQWACRKSRQFED